MARIPWFPAIAGILAGAMVFAVLAHQAPPLVVIRLFDGNAEAAMDLEGGYRVTYRAPAGAARELEERAAARGWRATTRVDGDTIILDLPGLTAAEAASLGGNLGRGLELKFVLDGAPEMRELAARAHSDPEAARAGITVEPDVWMVEETGVTHQDYYLLAADLAALTAYTAAVPVAADRERAYEFVTPRGPASRSAGKWRSYLVERKPIVTGADVASAEPVWDSYTNRPEVLLVFDAAGAKRFGDETARNVGRKLAIMLDGKVTSAPVIQTAIRGGRAQITMGGGDPRELQAQAEKLVNSLRAGSFAPRLPMVSAQAVPPRVAAGAVDAARWASVAVAALLVFLLCWGVGRALGLTLNPAILPAASAGGSLPWLRLLITLAAPVLLYLSGRVTLPFVDRKVLDEIGVGTPTKLSVFALGLGPALSAFFLVELVALAVPRWRRLRHGGPSGRGRLSEATALLTVLLAALQGWFIAAWMRGMGVYPGGRQATLVAILSLVGGALALLVLAALVSRYGLGNGISVLLVSGLVLEAIEAGGRLQHTPTTSQLVLILVPALATIAATVWIFRRRARGLRLPASGIIPISWAAGASLLFALLVGFGVGLPLAWNDALFPSTFALFQIHGALVLAFCVLFTYAFARTFDLRVLACSAAFVGLVYLVERGATSRLAPYFLGALPVMIGTAVVMDLIVEWRARARAGELVDVWPLHDVNRADDVVATLAAASIPAHLRGIYHRGLFHFFAPYVPISVMVPRDRAVEAAAVMKEWHRHQ